MSYGIVVPNQFVNRLMCELDILDPPIECLVWNVYQTFLDETCDFELEFDTEFDRDRAVQVLDNIKQGKGLQ